MKSVREWRKIDEESDANEKIRNSVATSEKDGKPFETPGMNMKKMRMVEIENDV